MPATWDIEKYGDFCLTLSQNLTPEQVLTAFGGDPREAQLMSASQSETGIGVTETSALLRAGHIGTWSFCIEISNPIGFTDLILKKLCGDSEAFALSRSGHSMTTFKFAQGGRLSESFEPRNQQTVRGDSHHAFFQRIQNTSPDASAAMASLQVMSEYIGAEITPSLLNGPLLTANLENVDRALLARPVPDFHLPARSGTRSVLGRHLGTIG